MREFMLRALYGVGGNTTDLEHRTDTFAARHQRNHALVIAALHEMVLLGYARKKGEGDGYISFELTTLGKTRAMMLGSLAEPGEAVHE